MRVSETNFSKGFTLTDFCVSLRYFLKILIEGEQRKSAVEHHIFGVWSMVFGFQGSGLSWPKFRERA